MSEDNEQYAYFTITDSFDPAAITKRVGLEPTESWRKGELKYLTQRYRQEGTLTRHRNMAPPE